TIDIVSRAKMVISFNTDAKIANLYNEMRNKYRTGGISETDVAYFLDDMRSYSRIPDEINDENIEEQIVFLNEYNVNTVLEERRREEVMQRKNADEIAELKEKVSGLELAIDIERKEKFLFEEESKRREQELRDELEQEKNERKQDLDELEGYRNEKWNKRLRWKKVLRGAFLILIVAALLVSAWLIFRFIAKLNPAACNILSVIISLGGVLVEIVGGMWKKFVTQASPKDCWDTNKRDNH
ncbi:MAG: hypothetical protein LUC91_08365, partial [Prevotella sp.]|nr:hypothetical protein [Prevotella sp.]